MSKLYKKEGEYLRIAQDENPVDPRKDNDGHVGTIVCWHPRLKLGDEQPREDPETYREKLPKNRIELPLYSNEHSGISLSVSSYLCKWDSGQVGFIYTTLERLEEHCTSVDVAEEYLRGEVHEYNQFLSGEVYGFTLYRNETCNSCGHVKENDIDSCWGFYGSDHKLSGLLESAGVNDLEEWEEVDE